MKVEMTPPRQTEVESDVGRERPTPPSITASKRIRICHIAATTEGAAWVFEQLRDLRDRFGYDVSVILSGSAGTLVDRFESADIRVLVSDFQFLGSSDLFALPRKIWALAQLLKRERFDIAQTHLFHSMVIGRIAAWLADVPVRLAMVAGPFHLEAYTPRWIDGSTQWMETGLIPSCEFSRTLYIAMGVPEKRLTVIYYGPDETRFDPSQHTAVDLRGEYGWPQDTPLIGMVAYFYPELGINRWTPPTVQGRAVKCHSDLIKAMPTILKEFPTAKLLLVGSGWEEGGERYLAKMEALVAELGLSESIKFMGYRTDVPAVLKALNVAVQASLSENLGGSIEGLLMECPMVATRVGGLVDSIIDGETGILVARGDPADLARGILTLLRDPSAAHELGRRGRSFMLNKFTLRRTVEDEDRLYQTLCAKAPAGYRTHRSAFRLIVAAAICGYLAFRYRVIDARILPAWDAGWRPWHFSIIRRLISRAIYELLRLLDASREMRGTEPSSIVNRRDSTGSTNDQFISIARSVPPPIAPELQLAARMMLYRFYAFFGRQQLGWGIRVRLRGTLRRWFEILGGKR
jgi:glycosyltransferase involved in cell wall biosynthesis